MPGLLLGVVGAGLCVGLAVVVLRRLRRTVIVIDGSNVMHWDGNAARLAHVRDVVAQVKAAGFRPVVWFDANAGYKVSNRYMDAAKLAECVFLPERDVHVAPKGTPADPLLLAMARARRALVLSNDRFRDWEAEFPEILTTQRMVRGRVRGGRVQLDVVTRVS